MCRMKFNRSPLYEIEGSASGAKTTSLMSLKKLIDIRNGKGEATYRPPRQPSYPFRRMKWRKTSSALAPVRVERAGKERLSWAIHPDASGYINAAGFPPQ